MEVCAVINLVTLERDVTARIRTFPTDPVTALGISSKHILSERFIHMYSCYVRYYLYASSDPDDYAGGVFDITFESPNTTVCFSINITTDDIFEDDEAFFIQLFSDDPATGLSSAIVPVAILDQSGVFS